MNIFGIFDGYLKSKRHSCILAAGLLLSGAASVHAQTPYIDWSGAGVPGADGADGGHGGATSANGSVAGGVGGSASDNQPGDDPTDGNGGNGADGTHGGQGGTGGAVGGVGTTLVIQNGGIKGEDGNQGTGGGGGGGGGAGLVYDSTVENPVIAPDGKVTIMIPQTAGDSNPNGQIAGGYGGTGSCDGSNTYCGGGGGGGVGLVVKNDGDYTLEIQAERIVGGRGGAGSGTGGAGGGGAGAIIYGHSPIIINFSAQAGLFNTGSIVGGRGGYQGGNSGDGLILTDGNDVTVIGPEPSPSSNKIIGVGYVQGTASDPNLGQIGTATVFSGDDAVLTLQGGMSILGGTLAEAGTQRTGLAVNFQGNDNRLILTTSDEGSSIQWSASVPTSMTVGVTLISIPGNGNTIELQPNTSIEGILDATGTDNGITLGGTKSDSDSHPSTFDLSKLGATTDYRGIQRLEKIGSSWWTADNAQGSDAPWRISNGHLVMGASGDLSNSAHITLGTDDTPITSIAVLNLGLLATNSSFNIKRLSGSSHGLIDDCTTVAAGDESCDPSDARSNAKLVITDAQSDEYAGKIQTAGGIEIAGGTQIFTGDVDNLGSVAVTGTGVLKVGAGGATGSLADLPVQIDTGAKLVFDRSDDVSFGGVFTGAGTIEQAGAQMLTFTADSSAFTGSTLIDTGSLWVDSGAVLGGTVTANSGTSLGGKGTIGGNTTISNGATLLGKEGFTLTFEHDLTLSSGSIVDVSLGQAGNTTGLFNVAGNLSFEGATLNIEDLGDFGPGLYRLFDYSGNLVTNNLVLGALPANVTDQMLEIQTTTANQVNIYYAGAVVGTFTSWDGGNPANHDNGRVDGGDGIWNANNNNWTSANGSVNGAWDNGNYAFFGVQGGTVTVDNTFGAITTQGLVFSTDGYQLTDQYITLASNVTPTVRVGDSTSAGAAMTATIGSELRGTDGLKKVDFGTLILVGDNSYTGGTTVSQGVLQIGNGGTEGSIRGDVVVDSDAYDHGTLAFNRSDVIVFDGTISGGGEVLQKGSGTTVFTGDNSYTGGLTIAKGTAEAGIADHAFGAGLLTVQTDGTADLAGYNTTVTGLTGAGSVKLGDATLTLNQDFDTTFSGIISEDGNLVKNGTGAFTLTGANSYTGLTTVDAGSLIQGQSGAFSSSASYLVGQNGVLDFGGFATALDTLTNSGTIRFGGTGGSTVTVNGTYTGNGGTLLMNIVLQGDNSKTDQLKVLGDTAGTTNLQFITRGGSGEQTTEGIKVVDVTGQSDGIFDLVSDYTTKDGEKAIVAGAYAYTLHQGSEDMPDDGDWYLRSALNNNPDPTPIYSPSVPIYEGMMQAMQALNSLPTLQQRTGNRYWKSAENLPILQTSRSRKDVPDRVTTGDNPNANGSMWGRVEGAYNHLEPETSLTGASQNLNVFQLQAGVDGQLYEGNRGKLIGSITGQYGTSHSNISSVYGDGTVDMHGWSLGTALTWYGDSGFYADGQAQATWYDGDLFSDTANTDIADGKKGFGYALGVEAGRRFRLNDSWSLTPQMQLIWSSISFDRFSDAWDADVSLRNGDSLRGRLGLSADYQKAWYGANDVLNSAGVYAIVNLYRDFLGDMRFEVADVAFDAGNSRTWGGIGGGGTYSWASGRYALYGEGSLNSPLNRFGDNYVAKGTLGFKLRW